MTVACDQTACHLPGGGVQRREEQDGQHYGSGPRADDEVPQADHDECVTAGQDARALLL